MLRFHRGYGRNVRFPMRLKRLHAPSVEAFIQVDRTMVHLTTQPKKFRGPISWPTAFLILGLEALFAAWMVWLLTPYH